MSCAAYVLAGRGPRGSASKKLQVQAAIAKAVDKRSREFATVRHYPRRALTVLGRTAVPLLPGLRGGIDAEPHGSPPDGVLGSVTLPRV